MEKFEKKQLVSGLKEGDEVSDVFFVKFKKGVSPYSKGYSFELILSDSSNQNISFKYWGNSDEKSVRALYESIKEDSIVFVKGKVSKFRERLQISANDPVFIKVLEKGEFNEADFIKAAKKDSGELYANLLSEISCVKSNEIKALLESIFKDKEISEAFKKHPGAIEIHHNWTGGLLEHSMEVLEYCKTSKKLFPDLNYDLLVAGALLHDIGKLEEIETTSRIKGTVKGQLIGHTILSSIFVEKKCIETKVSEETKNLLLHLIASHHGRKEFGSPKEPMIPEAIAVYYADELSSKIAEMQEFIEDSRKVTENAFMYSKRNNRNILLK